jgi:hypothetical protein
MERVRLACEYPEYSAKVVDVLPVNIVTRSYPCSLKAYCILATFAAYASIVWNPKVAPSYPSLALNLFLNHPFTPPPLAPSTSSFPEVSFLSPLRQSPSSGLSGLSLAATLVSLSLLSLSPVPILSNPAEVANVETVGDFSSIGNVGDLPTNAGKVGDLHP